MPTTVHIPPDLLAKVDARARELKISRNKLIVRALEREIEAKKGWPEGFFARFQNPDPELVRAVEEMERYIRERRGRRKEPPVL